MPLEKSYQQVWDGDLLLPVPSESEYMGTFHIYIDESGKSQNKNTEFTALCGYVGHLAEWQRVSNDWTNCRLKWQVPPIHLARIMNPDKQDDDWKKVKEYHGDNWPSFRDTMLEDFGAIIASSAIICVGIVIDADGYRRAYEAPDSHLNHKDSNVFSFHHIIMRGIERIARVDRTSPISLILDDDPQNVKAYYDLLAGLKSQPEPEFEAVKRRIHAITFAQDESYPGLQAADMVAYEIRHFARKVAADNSTEPSFLLNQLTHAGLHAPQFFSAEGLIQLGQNIKKAIDREKENDREAEFRSGNA